MKNTTLKLLKKECILSASPLSYIFLISPILIFAPGYPIVLCAFFICMGIFNTFQQSRVNNDILYTALLPVKKTDVVKAKFLFTILLQLIAFVISIALSVLRLKYLESNEPYLSNQLLSSNLTCLSFILLIFTIFNSVYLPGFFKSAFFVAKPYFAFIFLTVLLTGSAEFIVHIPGIEFLAGISKEDLLKQVPVLAVCVLLYVGLTYLAFVISKKRFVKIDL